MFHALRSPREGGPAWIIGRRGDLAGVEWAGRSSRGAASGDLPQDRAGHRSLPGWRGFTLARCFAHRPVFLCGKNEGDGVSECPLGEREK